MKDFIITFMRKESFKKIARIIKREYKWIILLILGFYWCFLRPVIIKKNCYKYTYKSTYSYYDHGETYNECLLKNGL